jgi:PAS domain S-box-containing protein
MRPKPQSENKTQLPDPETSRKLRMKSIHDACCEIDRNFTIIDVSPSVETTFKYSREELIGQSLNILFADKEPGDNLRLKLQEEKSTVDCKLELIDKPGKRLTATLDVLRVAEKEDTGACFMITLKDISSHERIEDEIQKELDTLEQKVKERTEELLIINGYLRREIEERKTLQEQLQLSQKKYMTLIELLPQIIFETDHAYNITFANPIAFKLFGYEPSDLETNINILDLIIPEEHQMATENIKRRREEDVVHGNIYTARRKNGTSFPIIVYSNHVIKDGVPKGLRGIVVDISEIKKTKNELIESEKKFRDLFETASDAIFIMDFEGKLISANAATYKMYRYKRSEVESINIKNLVEPSFLPVISDKIKGILNGDVNTGSFELLTYTKQKNPVWIELTINIIKEKGRSTAMQGIARDITYRKETDDIIRKREKELKEKSESLQESNAALRGIIKTIEDEKKSFQEEILISLKKLISPYIDKLKNSKPDNNQSALLNVIERNLEEIALPYAQSLKSEYYNLSRQELQVALLVKEGKQSKEISEIMGLSTKTVEGYRNTIRKKLGLNKREDSLKSYLIDIK